MRHEYICRLSEMYDEGQAGTDGEADLKQECLGLPPDGLGVSGQERSVAEKVETSLSDELNFLPVAERNEKIRIPHVGVLGVNSEACDGRRHLRPECFALQELGGVVRHCGATPGEMRSVGREARLAPVQVHQVNVCVAVHAVIFSPRRSPVNPEKNLKKWLPPLAK